MAKVDILRSLEADMKVTLHYTEKKFDAMIRAYKEEKRCTDGLESAKMHTLARMRYEMDQVLRDEKAAHG
ncbi:MAG: hypothetical protein AAF412_10025 [Pseudomonadota bacterium]